MSIDARFVADFASFYAAVQKADVSLNQFESSTKKVESQLNRMVGSFSGADIMKQAAIAEDAVMRVGGASKLTEAEQARVNRTITEALTKYKALGIDAPRSLQMMADETKRVEKATEDVHRGLGDVKGTVLKMAAAFGIGFSVGAIKSWVGSTLEAASRIDDLSKKLGVSTQAVQGWDFAATQAGASIDDVDKAVAFMNKTLSQGGVSTKDILKDIGLEFTAIRSMRPEDAFNTIASAIAKVSDPMLQAEAATKLFSRSGQDLLPAIKDGFVDVANGAAKMSDETVKRLADAEDAWSKLGSKATVVSGEMIGGTIAAVDIMTRSWNDFFQFIERSNREGWAKAIEMANGGRKGRDVNLPAMTPRGSADREAIEGMQRSAEATRKLMDAWSGRQAITDAETALTNINRALKEGTPLQLMSREHQDAINKSMAAAIAVYERFGNEAPPDILAVFWATRDLKKELDATLPVVSGLSQEILQRLGPGLKQGHDVTVPWIGVLKTVKGEMGDIIAIQYPPTVKAAMEETARAKEATEKWHSALGDLSQSLAQLSQVAGGSFGAVASGLATIVSGYDAATKGAELFRKGVKAGADGIAEMVSGAAGLIAAGASIGKALGPLLGLRTGKLGELLGTNTEGRSLVKGFAESMGGFDALHQQLLTLGEAGELLWIKLTQGVGRSNPDQARAAIDAVTTALEKANVAAVTQNPAAAAGYQTFAELQQLADAAKRTYDYMVSSGQYSASQLADAFQKARDAQVNALDDTAQAAIKSYKKELDAITSEMQSLQQSIAGEAPEEFMGVVEANARARIAELADAKAKAEKQMEEAGIMARGDAQETVDAVGGIGDKLRGNVDEWEAWAGDASRYIQQLKDEINRLSIPSPGDFPTLRSPGMRVGSASPIVIHNHTELDGREIARSTAYHLPGYVEGEI